MNIQVRYYSRGGNTKKLAERAFPQFQKKLQDKGIQVDSKNFYQKHLFKKLGLTKNC